MTFSAIGIALQTYQELLTACCETKQLEETQVLELLNARDRLHEAIGQTSPSLGQQQDIYALDLKLKTQSPRLIAHFDFKTYRQSLNKTPEQWWWFLDTTYAHGSDWLFKAATVCLWATSWGLLVNISGRFLLGGAGLAGLSAVALSNLLPLLNTRSHLTTSGDEGIQLLFDRFRLSNSWQIRLRCTFALMLAAALFGALESLPKFSKYYNGQAQALQKAKQVGSAEAAYKRSISLDPDNLDAHYNLATLYEDIQKLDLAEREYSVAVLGGLPDAYNNLARLYLDQDSPKADKAAVLLYQGRTLANQQNRQDIQYSLHKNLGWALFLQKQYEPAQTALKTAIEIANGTSPLFGSIPVPENRASAHCLLAQTLEAEADKKTKPEALSNWQKCCQLGSLESSEQNPWILLARQRLEAANLNHNETCKTTAPPV
jgi:tetratricopeptide (TPR) repeat protein